MNTPAQPASPLDGLVPALARAAAPAVEALRQGAFERAAALFAPLLPLAPGHAGLLRLAGMAERMRGNVPGAVDLLRRAATAAPADALAASSLGVALVQSGDEDAGLAELHRACALAPRAAALWNNLGKALLDADRLQDAVEPLRQAVALDAGFRPPRYSLAYALGVLGDIAEAAAHYRALIAQRRDDGEAWIGLAQLKRDLLDDGDLAAIQALLKRTDLHPADRIALEFACADVLHRKGDCAGAFAAWQRANAGVRARRPWNAARFAACVEGMLAMDWPAPSDDAPSQPVVFVVGLPRSGTSIVEQILACHPQVAAAGESEALGHVLREEAFRRGGDYPQALSGLRGDDYRRLGREYLRRATRKLPSRPCLTDKLPGNWMYIGPARAMLSGARFVVCRRDPVETGFSCFRQRFSGDNQAFSYALDDIGRYWRGFDQVVQAAMARWPGQMHELDYQRLVADPEPVIRALLGFCDLPFDDACLHPERNTRAVRTLSATQVRKPLHAGSAVAARYGDLLDPLREALAGERPGAMKGG